MLVVFSRLKTHLSSSMDSFVNIQRRLFCCTIHLKFLVGSRVHSTVRFNRFADFVITDAQIGVEELNADVRIFISARAQ